MGLFKRKKSKKVAMAIMIVPEKDKWEEEKTKRAIMLIVSMYRNSKIVLPIGEEGRIIMDEVKKIDPDNKKSLRDIVETLINNPEVRIRIEGFKNPNIIDNETLCGLAREHYGRLKTCLSDTTPQAWDEMEYASQQVITALHKDNVEIFFKEIQKQMDIDPGCPFLLKKIFQMFPVEEDKPKFPTNEEEKLAEKIMNMVDDDLKDVKPDVYRALVDSLKWRGVDELKRTYDAVKETPKKERKIRGRESCIFIESKDSVHYVG